MESQIRVRPISQNYVLYFSVIMLIQPSAALCTPAAGDTLLFKMKLSVRIWVARTCFAKKRSDNCKKTNR